MDKGIGGNAGLELATQQKVRQDGELLHELGAHQIELEMQNEQLRHAQTELERSRDRYIDFYDFAPVGYLTLSRDGVIEEINLTGAELLGVARGKLLQRRFAPFVAPSDRERWDRFFPSVFRKDCKQRCELKFQHGDKSCLHAQLDCLMLYKEGREAVARVSITDISELKMLEKDKQEMLERFHTISRLTPGIVYQFRMKPNGSTSMPYVSDAFQELFRLDPALVKKDASRAFAVVHPEDLDSVMSSIQASARSTSAWQQDFRLKHEDGTICWLFGNSLPQREADGSTLWHGFMADITDRKLAEQAVLESEQRFRVLSVAIPQIVWVTRPDGWCIHSSQQWEDYTGLPLEHSLGHGWCTPFHAEDMPRAQQAWQEAVEKETVYTTESRLRRKDGAYRWWLIRGAPLYDHAGRLINWVGSCTDIEDQKQTEQALLQRSIDLGVRVQELYCLYEISRLTSEHGLSLDEVYAEAVQNIPQGFYFPDIACASITCHGKQFSSDGYTETPWKISATLLAGGVVTGSVQVCYLEQRPPADEGPFLREERLLLDALAIKLGLMQERKQAELKLEDYAKETDLRNQILALIGQEMVLPELLEQMVQKVQTLHPEMLCRIVLTEHLNQGGLPSDQPNCPCSAALHSKQCFLVEDMSQHDCPFGLNKELRSCCAQPILDATGKLHGVLTIFFKQPEQLTPAKLSTFEHYGKLILLMIERSHARQVQLSEQELKGYKAASRRYAAHLENMREEEKNNFAREMHDNLGSTLTALRIEAFLLGKKISGHQESAVLQEHTGTIVKLIDSATADMRRIIIGLRPSILDDFGLKEALEWHGEQFQKRTGIEYNMHCEMLEWNELDKELPINLFRIFQEALTNVMRHAQATLVEVELKQSEQEILLSVCDNGIGVQQAAKPGSFGMVGMRERAAQMGGQISFAQPEQGGCCVTVRLPLGLRRDKPEIHVLTMESTE